MNNPNAKPDAARPVKTDHPKTTPAEEWGEGLETGRAIARSGDTEGEVPGATGDDAKDPRSGKK